MLTIKKVIEAGMCALCDKEKEVAAVIMDGRGASEIQLCWADVRKMANMQMRMNGQAIPRRQPALPLADIVDSATDAES